MAVEAAKPFVIASQSIQPGKTGRVELPVTTLATGTAVTIPVVVINGKYPGPTLLVSAAIHGDELNGIEIVRQVMASTQARRLHGTLVAAPVVNVFGYLMRTRYLPDRRDLNRSFPGSPKGSLAGRIAHLFLNQVVAKCDFGIDFHTGSNDRVNMPQIRANLLDEQTAEIARAFGPPVIVQSRVRAQSLRATVAQRGMPMLVYEGGEAARFDAEPIRVGLEGTLRVMKHIGMLNGDPIEASAPPIESPGSSWVRTPRGGIWHCEREIGDYVAVGDSLGKVMDIYGAVRRRVKAHFGGLIIGKTNNPLVSRGDAVLHIAHLEESSLVGNEFDAE